jgi:hypothetical protein
MKCDDFLPALETGGFFRRWIARRHARRCGNCTAALAMLDGVKEALAPPSGKSGLPAHLRRRWMAVAQTEASPAEPSPAVYRIGPGTIWLKRAAALAAIVLLVLVPLLIYKFHGRATPVVPGPMVMKDRITVFPITLTQVDRAAELAQLDTEIVQLQTNVRSLIKSAERLEARQRLALVLAQNTKW